MLLVFDFDGTLMDTLRDLAESASDLAEAYGGCRLTESEVAAMIGDGAPVLVQRVLATAGIDSPPPEALPRYLAFYDRRVLEHTAPYPGVPRMLGALAPHHQLALLTNKPEASTRELLTRTGLAAFFDHGVFGDSELPRKPDPEGLRWLMRRHGAEPGDTLMVGDSTMDLDAARAAGVRVCLARYGFGFQRIPQSSIRPDDWIIDEPLELVSLLSPNLLRRRPLTMNTDTAGWSGEGAFTPVLIEALQAIGAIASIKVEDAPSSRADAGYAFIANEIYVTFRTEVRQGGIERLGEALTIAEGVGAPDYGDDGMLQYLRTERIVAPYQTKGVKVVELVRIYEAGTERRG